MKLIKFGTQGSEKPGVLLSNGTSIDVSAFTPDFNEAFFESGGLHRLSSWIENHATTAPVVPPGTRLGSPIARPSKIICIGLNYRDHAAESGMAEPSEPVVFFKATTAIVGPDDDLVIPRNSEKTDWEVELAVVIGRVTRHVTTAEAPACIAGYVLHNDYSERAWQLERGGQLGHQLLVKVVMGWPSNFHQGHVALQTYIDIAVTKLCKHQYDLCCSIMWSPPCNPGAGSARRPRP